MKIKTVAKSYAEVMSMAPEKRKKVSRPSFLFRLLVRILAIFELRKVKFSYKKTGMERLGKREPCLYLMNHSSFIDLKIASAIIFPRPYNIVCTYDGFVGKRWLMRALGCIPTGKFISDLSLVKDMGYALKKHKSSVLMYPEAGYSFDGTATVLPDSLGRCVKLLGVPVVMIKTSGAFLRDPLYNNLQLRRVKITAEEEFLLSAEDIKEKTPAEINDMIRERFTFDEFRVQQESGTVVSEPFRADCLNRVLYKCPSCLGEGCTEGKGTKLICHSCKKEYELTETGFMKAVSGETEFDHIPSWFRWQRECVKTEIEEGRYRLDVPVKIAMLVNTKALYTVGEGRLIHDKDGFTLSDDSGKVIYTQKPLSTYTLNSDYYWYEMGDVIGIGNKDALYYCFPEGEKDIVTKARLAAEELYKIARKAVRE